MSKEIRSRLLFAGALTTLAALTMVSSRTGIPHDTYGRDALPGVALGWRLLFHIERASAILGVMAVVLLVAWRGAHGRWPVKLGNVEYAPKETVSVAADLIAALNDRLERQDARLRKLEATQAKSTEED